MPTKLEVVNQALNEIGRLPVTNINDSDDSLLISGKLDVLLPEMLLRTDWNFAIKYIKDDTPLTVNFSPDFQYTYQLPSDYNRFDRAGYAQLTFPYRLVDSRLLCDERPVSYYYVVNNVDYEVITPLFYRALSLYAAAKSAMALTNKEELTLYLENEYIRKLNDAILQNDMDRRVVSTPFNDFDRIVYV